MNESASSLNDETFGSEDDLVRRILTLAQRYSDDPLSVYPQWLREAGSLRGAKRRFFVCGTSTPEELTALAGVGEIVAVVDDNVAASWSTWVSPTPPIAGQPAFAAPVLSTHQWLERAKADRQAVSVILTPRWTATRHFRMHCEQNDLLTLDPLALMVAYEREKIPTPQVGRFLHYGAKFFQHAVEHAQSLIETRELLADRFSRLTLLNLVLYRLTHRPSGFERIFAGYGSSYGPGTYLLDSNFLRFGSDEVAIDGGAFDGDSLDRFIRAVNGKFKRIHCFEPAADSTARLRARVRALHAVWPHIGAGSIEVVEKGLWSSDGILRFSRSLAPQSSSGTSPSALSAHLVESHLSPLRAWEQAEIQDMDEVAVTSIDAATDRDATYIKLEVEGSEAQALLGAQKTLERMRPKLAVAVYHKPEDLHTLPQLIQSLRGGYRMGIRQHSLSCPDATYLYCV